MVIRNGVEIQHARAEDWFFHWEIFAHPNEPLEAANPMESSIASAALTPHLLMGALWEVSNIIRDAGAWAAKEHKEQHPSPTLTSGVSGQQGRRYLHLCCTLCEDVVGSAPGLLSQQLITPRAAWEAKSHRELVCMGWDPLPYASNLHASELTQSESSCLLTVCTMHSRESLFLGKGQSQGSCLHEDWNSRYHPAADSSATFGGSSWFLKLTKWSAECILSLFSWRTLASSKRLSLALKCGIL